MSNKDVNSNAKQLQSGLTNWYTNGLEGVDKTVAGKLWIDDKHTVVDKQDVVSPGKYLDIAKYRDVIERDGSTTQTIR